MLLNLIIALASPVDAAVVADVTFPNTVQVAGQSIILNGAGLREFAWIDLYVGALYLPRPMTDPNAIIRADVPKRIVLHFVFREVPKNRLGETFTDRIEDDPKLQAIESEILRMTGLFETMHPGDEMILDYVPGKGVVLLVKGQEKGVFPGEAFMIATFNFFLGADPIHKGLRSAMLRGGIPD
jgi:hypothetical protein